MVDTTPPPSLANRLSQFKTSPTLAISNKAAEMRAQGIDVIGLAVGEPDFDTPDFIKEAAVKALQAGCTKYTAVGGTPDLKQAIVTKLKRDNQLIYEAGNILVSTGAKQSLFNTLQAIINLGDEVIIPAPYWVSYPDMVILAEGKPIIVSSDIDTGLKLSAQSLAAAITPKTKAIILNSPSNPSGMAYTKEEWIAIGDVLEKHPNIWVITDDIYEKIRWGASPFFNIVNACPHLMSRSVVINGVSKAYAMTGWRIGFAAGPKPLIAGMAKLQSQSTSCPNAIAQAAAAEAFLGDQQCIDDMVNAFERRYQLVQSALNAMDGVVSLPTQGAFYVFPDMREVIKRLNLSDDIALANHLLDVARVAIVPGSAFGCPGFIRLSFAASDDVLKEALQRMQAAIR